MGRIADRLRTALSWLHSLLLLEVCYLLMAELMSMGTAEAAWYAAKGILLLLPIAASSFLLQKVDNLWLFLACGAVVSFAMWQISASLLTGALSLAVFMIRSYVRIRKGKLRRMLQEMPGEAVLNPEAWEIPTLLDRPSPVHWILFGAAYVFTLVYGSFAYLRPLFALMAAEIVVCFVCCYMDSLESFAKDHHHLANFPVRTLTGVAKRVFLLLFAGLLLFMLPGILWGDEPLTRVKFSFDFAHELPPETGQETGGGMGEMLEQLGLTGETFEPPKWLTTLFEILFYVILVAGLCFLFLLFWRALKNMAGSFAESGEDEVFSLEDEKTDSGERMTGARRVRDGWLSPGMRVRRRYRRMLLRSAKSPFTGTETPAQLEEKADLSRLLSAEGQEHLHSLYEKARYSREGCTREDLAGRK